MIEKSRLLIKMSATAGYPRAIMTIDSSDPSTVACLLEPLAIETIVFMFDRPIFWLSSALCGWRLGQANEFSAAA
jgi:hypothetical protein